MRKYSLSEALLARAERTIPLGSQTFSKSRTQYPFGVSPYFIKRAKGSHVWDVDGNEYVDLINGLAAITLGNSDPDATSGAERLARAYTGRDRVAVCGYHGWQDWYIGSTARNRGVPAAVCELTHPFPYNDLAALDSLLRTYAAQLAAVIMEPMNVAEPAPGYLAEVKELVHKHGALLIFDETITGFRYSNGGAQELFGVIPDLATFGKGLANGYPVSAVAGRADVMKLMEEIFFSFTFGGETLSLAAALATMRKLEREPVVNVLCSQGKKIIEGVNALIEKHEASDLFSLAGQPAWSFFVIKDSKNYSSWKLKTLFLQEMFVCGVLFFGFFFLCFVFLFVVFVFLFFVFV